MSNITWATPSGLVGDVLVNIPVSLTLIAYDSNYAATISYQLIGGALPNGMTLSPAGVISGTPTYASPEDNYFQTENYDFIVRAVSSSGATPVDSRFTIALVNVINNDFNWITPAGSLGTVPAGEYYSQQLQANSTSAVTYQLIAGELPNGMRVVPNGFLQGVPTFLESVTVDQSQSFRFTVRATNAAGHVNDRSFVLNVTSVSGPVIEPTTTLLGSFFDGTYFSQQLSVVELNPNAKIQWSVTEGALPAGVTLSNTGLLSGYLQPLQLIGQYGPAGYDGDETGSVGLTATIANCTISGYTLSVGSVQAGTVLVGMTLTGKNLAPNTQIIAAVTEWNRGTAYPVGSTVAYQNKYYVSVVNIPANKDFTIADWTETTTPVQSIWKVYPSQSLTTPTTIFGTVDNILVKQEYGSVPYDFAELSQSSSYSFTIQAYDGANYDLQKYVIQVISRSNFTADSSDSVNNTFLTVDSLNVNPPVILNASTTQLPAARQNSYYAYKFDGYDFAGDTVSYFIASTAGTFDSDVPGVDVGFDPLDRSDFLNGAAGSFDQTSASTSNLPGLILDPNTGWLYGKVNPSSVSLTTYSVGIIVSKVSNGVTYSRAPVYFTLPVLGDVNNVINWVSPVDLGTVDNGSVSELAIVATSAVGKDIVYTLYDQPGVRVGLPQGLTLLPSGELSGRVSFEVFDLDDFTTTFDGDSTTIDRKYTFMVQAQTVDETATAYQEFTISVNVIDRQPYDNLYLTALPSTSQRSLFMSIINDTNIFDTKEIYRPTDPWFGINSNIDMLFLAGLTPSTLAEYQAAIQFNHWTKKYTFGSVNTAVVLDTNYNVKYEVVYLSLIDPGETATGASPGLELNLSGIIENPYVDAKGDTFDIVYPNSTTNMITRLVENIGYADQSSLPPWMTSNQLGSTTTTFSPPLGYTKAVVLAYTKPGASKSIAYRLNHKLNNTQFDFNNIEFAAAGYQLDNFYSTYFDPATQRYVTGKETTFDYLSTKNVGTIVAQVKYGVNVPFSEINGRPVSYINAKGGLDGVTNYATGDTLIFIRQENFNNPGPYDGWVRYYDSYIGDNIATNVVEGYGSEGFDLYSLVSGYLEQAQATENFTGTGTQSIFAMVQREHDPNNITVTVNSILLKPNVDYTVSSDLLIFTAAPINYADISVYHKYNAHGNLTSNQRAGVWKINIVNGVVFLSFVETVLLNQRVQIISGASHSGSIYYYVAANADHTVPYYELYKITADAIKPQTTFNKGTTRFFSNRDQYYTPNGQDKYVKFPQYGVFN